MNGDFSGDVFRESRMFLNRIAASVLFIAVATLALVLRLVYLQIAGHELYSGLSRDNQVKISPLPPSRGLIFDRNGEVLADNIATYSLEIIPEEAGDLNATLIRLRDDLSLTDDEIIRFHVQRSQHKSFEAVPLRLELTEEEMARVAVRMPFLPGVEIRTRLLRSYPYGALAAHVVGYVARINEAELKKLDPAEYHGTFHIGKNGVEKSYEKVLHGKSGYEERETNAQGRPIRSLGHSDALSGGDLYLSLDIRLQKIALDGLGQYSGAVVAIEPTTGKVLVLASNPSFNPNPFIHGISSKEYSTLRDDPERPLYDRTIRGLYPPGSTVKPGWKSWGSAPLTGFTARAITACPAPPINIAIGAEGGTVR